MERGVVSGACARCGGPLAFAFEQAGAARGLRHLDGHADDLVELRRAASADGVAISDVVDALDALTGRVRATLQLERLMVGDMVADVSLGDMLERFTTQTQLASPVVAGMMTSLPEMVVAGEIARAVLIVLREVMHVLEASASPARPMRLFLAMEPDESELIIAFAAHGAEATPVPTASAAAAFRRAERVLRLLGGDISRGVRDGLMIFGIAVDLPAPAVSAEGY